MENTKFLAFDRWKPADRLSREQTQIRCSVAHFPALYRPERWPLFSALLCGGKTLDIDWLLLQ